MRLRTCLALSLLALPAITAPAPGEDAHALVVKYTTVLKDIPRLRAEKKPLPREAVLESLYARLVRETQPEIRQVLLVARQFLLEARIQTSKAMPDDVRDLLSSIDNSFGLEMAAQIPPNSPALELVAAVEPDYLNFIAWHASGGGFVPQMEAEAAEKAFAYLDQVFAQNPSRDVKALALISGAELNSRPRRLAETKAYVDRLEAFAPGHPAIAKWREWLVRAAKEDQFAPRVGGKVPAFKLQDFDHQGQTLTPGTFKGKYLLLDFWATWCGPCLKELPNLHAAQAKFKGRGLEVLSISRDQKAEAITAFRKNAVHPMPWRHAFPQGKEADALMAAFQVRGIPHILLIGPDGTILATTEDLRGSKLEETLRRCLPAVK
jgi:thiol-disulfide isomerase/thioredoxin